MLTPQEFASRWGQAELVRVSPWLLQDAELLPLDKEFLARTGLPRTAAIPMGGAGDFALLPAETDATPAESVHSLLEPYRTCYLLLGFVNYQPDFGHNTYFCIEKKSGAIRMLDNQDDFVWYVNSSVLAFAEALLVYRSFIKPSDDDLLKDNDSGRLRRLKQEIKASDPKSVTKRTNYWPIMLADLADQI